MHKEQLLGDEVYLIHEFLSPEECDEFIAGAEAEGFGDAPITTAAGPVMFKEIRNNERVMIDDPELAASLWERASPMVANSSGVWRPVGLNERFRYYRYDPGQKFAAHGDGRFIRDASEMSFLTFMVYLNDGFGGGDTVFFEGGRANRRETVRVRPVRGTALVFDHPLLHEGSEVTSGRKYVLRSDVMFRADVEA